MSRRPNYDFSWWKIENGFSLCSEQRFLWIYLTQRLWKNFLKEICLNDRKKTWISFQNWQKINHRRNASRDERTIAVKQNSLLFLDQEVVVREKFEIPLRLRSFRLFALISSDICVRTMIEDQVHCLFEEEIRTSIKLILSVVSRGKKSFSYSMHRTTESFLLKTSVDFKIVENSTQRS